MADTFCTVTPVENTGSALWQVQDGQHRLLGYASKTLPPACENYSIGPAVHQ